ncbi:MAG: DUF2828 family protein [Synergistaceae bacterium]|nr:DUF2828 family protein [Synergistaceae bacterium]
MLEHLKNEANFTRTENSALTYKSTGSECLDLFAAAGALRNADAQDIAARFMRAFAEDRDIAVRILFYARDIRGGLGERKFFRVALHWLAVNYPESVIKNLALIPEYGRFDDFLALLTTPCEKAVAEFIKSGLESDMNSPAPSLLAKWLPSINASSKYARMRAKLLAKLLGMDLKTYRKTLSELRAKIKIIENNLRLKDYSFDYEKQPSKAMLKYRDAFIRNDSERYSLYMAAVMEGRAKLHTETLTPYEIILPITDRFSLLDKELTEQERKVLDTTWHSLEDFTNDENALVVVDGSGSMYCHGVAISPISVALSLGIYFAERNKGEFANHFITFSETPQLVKIKGSDIYEKVKYCMGFNEVANTDLQKVFELILNAAVKNNVPQEQMPSSLYIISDMEFDSCVECADITNFEYAKKLFNEHGYNLPRVIFWNVDSRNLQQPVTMNEQGVCLVSGVSPRIFAMIKRHDLSPYSFMMSILDGERYKNITA